MIKDSRYSEYWKLEKVFFNESVSTILKLVVASMSSSFLYNSTNKTC